MITQKLDEAIKAVCPIDGVSIGRRNDKATWRIDFKAEATTMQRMAARDVMAAFDETADFSAPQEPDARQILRALVKKGVITEAEARAGLR